MRSIKPYENWPLIFALHPLKASHVSFSDNTEYLEKYECDLNRISREREKEWKSKKKQEKAKGQWTVKIHEAWNWRISICINYRDHFHEISFNRMLVERREPFLGTGWQRTAMRTTVAKMSALVFYSEISESSVKEYKRANVREKLVE